MSNIVSLSGGKDSTCMLLMMLEKNMQIDDVVFFDTGWEFPEMYDHLEQLEKYTGITITRIKPKIPFDTLMLENKRVRGKRKDVDYGYGYPLPRLRWCTALKTSAIAKHVKKFDNPKQFIGIAYDEKHRCKEHIYPLVVWKITEKQALDYCKERGFAYGGLYEHFKRVSCYCCPLQGIEDLRNLRKYHPELWENMVVRDLKLNRHQESQCVFKSDWSIPQLEQRFRNEDRQQKIPI